MFSRSTSAPHRPIPRQQRGGTILGFCIGLLVGLLIALGISIFVNKIPMKIKGDPNSRTMTLEEELQRNRNWDPNAPLRSRTPNLNGEKEEADKNDKTNNDSQTDTDTANTNTSDTTNTSDNNNTPSTAPAQPQSNNDPLGDLARAVTNQVATGQSTNNTVVNSGTQTGGLIYFVQTGAYRNGGLAEEQRAKLSLVGLNARVTEREHAGRPIYRVRLGPYNSLPEAERAKTKVESHDFVGSLVRVPR